MFRRPHYIAFAVILFLALILVSLPERATTRLKLAFGALFLPLFGLAGSTHQLADQAGGALRSKRELLAEIEQLRRENDALRLQTNREAELWEENHRLREAVGWQRQAPGHPRFARVILRDPANWWRTLRIDLGARDGLVPDLPVMTTDGLVGRIHQVMPASAEVVLIGDPNCRVSALVQETLEKAGSPRRHATVVTHGVIVSSASSVLDPTVVDLTFLDRQSAVKPGQRVITSGLGPVFPRGLPIGHVVETSSVGYGLFMEARVKLSADLAHLEHVWVLMP